MTFQPAEQPRKGHLLLYFLLLFKDCYNLLPCFSLHGSHFASILLKLEVPRVEHAILGVTCWARSRIDASPSCHWYYCFSGHITTPWLLVNKTFILFHVCYSIIWVLLLVLVFFCNWLLENKFLPLKLFLPMKFNFYVCSFSQPDEIILDPGSVISVSAIATHQM